MNLSSQNKPNPNFSMSSMTDLIFILLIFFLVTSSSNTFEVLPIDLPSSENPKEIKKEKINIIVGIKKDASCEKYYYTFLDGLTYCGWENAKIALDSVVSQIELNVEKEFSAIILAAEKNTPIDECVKLIDFASKYNYNIAVAAPRKKEDF